jgi:hypothetical protein
MNPVKGIVQIMKLAHSIAMLEIRHLRSLIALAETGTV